MTSSRHWAQIAERGTTLGMATLLLAYRLGGTGLFKLFLFPVICFYFIVRSDARRASREYLQRVSNTVPNQPPVSLRRSFAHFWQFALALIDKFAIWMGKITRDQVEVHNPQLVDELLARGQGGIIAISHLGNFEICHALSHGHARVRLTILHHTRHAEKFNRLLGRYIGENSVKLLQVTDINVGLAMQFSEKIANGEFIAIAADRVPVDNPSATMACDFLGETADFPVGPWVLASVLAAPVLLLVCMREQGKYHIYFEKLADGGRVPRAERQQFIGHCTEKFARRLEYHVCRQPLQWFNFYDFWHRSQ